MRNFEMGIHETVYSWNEVLLELKTKEFFWFDQSGKKAKEQTLADDAENTILMIGPEGGFDDDEKKTLGSIKSPVCLNSQILKVETAAICAVNWASLLA